MGPTAYFQTKTIAEKAQTLDGSTLSTSTRIQQKNIYIYNKTENKKIKYD